MSRYPNYGWSFYKEYYHEIDFSKSSDDKDNCKLFKKRNHKLLAAKIPETGPHECSGTHFFLLTTQAPGLILGTGIAHQSMMLGEIKLGFSFDHTSGLPFIPGSALKGSLRSVFPGSLSNAASRTKEDDEKSFLNQLAEQRKTYLQWIWNKQLKFGSLSDLSPLEAHIFEGCGTTTPYGKDEFLGGKIVGPTGHNLFQTDFITPHKNLLRNPVPIEFLKVKGGVTFRFDFNLHDHPALGISADQKAQLFKTLLVELGIGAKRNVGYGRLVEL